MVVLSPESGLNGEVLGKFLGVRSDQGAKIRRLLEEEAAKFGLSYEVYVKYRTEIKEFSKVQVLFKDILSRIEICIRDSRSVVPLYPVFEPDLSLKEISEYEEYSVKKPLKYFPILSQTVKEVRMVKKLIPGDTIDYLNKPVHELLKTAIAHLGGEDVVLVPALLRPYKAVIDEKERSYLAQVFPELLRNNPLYYLCIEIIG